jgi:dehydrogenase/reductase SDR family protein 12
VSALGVGRLVRPADLGRLVRPAAPALDALLESGVAPSFSAAGHEVRRRLFGWASPAAGALAGRSVLLTGATSPLGLATAAAFAGLGAELTMVGRSAARGERACLAVTAATGNPAVSAAVADPADLASLRALAAEVIGRQPRLDVVVHLGTGPRPAREETADGLERTFAEHVAGPHLLTAALLDALGPGSRLVFVASGGIYGRAVRLDDLQSRKGRYRGAVVHARAKRAQVALARTWAERLAGRGVAVHAMHPGWTDSRRQARDRPRAHRLLRPVLRSPAQAADTIVWLATAEGLDSGWFWLDRRPRPTDRLPWTPLSPAERAQLWDAVTAAASATDLVRA